VSSSTSLCDHLRGKLKNVASHKIAKQSWKTRKLYPSDLAPQLTFLLLYMPIWYIMFAAISHLVTPWSDKCTWLRWVLVRRRMHNACTVMHKPEVRCNQRRPSHRHDSHQIWWSLDMQFLDMLTNRHICWQHVQWSSCTWW